ncbi:discoidin domain-containing protein [Paraflavitalea speifideaquila]|uniref:discoidin domain-containing protein n=1 Tax=Paraflavitalea speifideaquila TaxID=3076558 RepID=UPI0028E3CFD0|nr:discoidin domain-containing protein [Paraflavitalea speifideiaquila]
MSEVLWSPKEQRNWPGFEKRLQTQFKRYDLWGSNYSKAYYDLKASITPNKDNNGVVWSLQTAATDGKISYSPSKTGTALLPYTKPFVITKDTELGGTLLANGKPTNWVWQKFTITKATGKKVTISTPTADNRQGNGGTFGLVNGARSDKGITSDEWLGWQGPDMEAVIDLGKEQSVSSVNIHILDQQPSWVYPPQRVEVYASADGKAYELLGKTSELKKEENNMASITVPFAATNARFIKVVAKNHGIISEGKPGSGSKAWLFVDEIGVK